jgi:signal transduction histidine kinase
MCWQRRLSLACNAGAVADARRFCFLQLQEAVGGQAAARDYIEDTVLVASELVSNAVKAGCAQAVVEIDVHHHYLRLSVTDDVGGQPEIQHPPASQGHGRGLQIVARLSRDWGVEAAAGGKQVWAEMVLPSQLTSGLSCERPGLD